MAKKRQHLQAIQTASGSKVVEIGRFFGTFKAFLLVSTVQKAPPPRSHTKSKSGSSCDVCECPPAPANPHFPIRSSLRLRRCEHLPDRSVREAQGRHCHTSRLIVARPQQQQQQQHAASPLLFVVVVVVRVWCVSQRASIVAFLLSLFQTTLYPVARPSEKHETEGRKHLQ